MSYALVLLCGGLSTRMGTNKAFLPFGEYTLMEYQVRRFRPNFEKIYLSVPKMTDLFQWPAPVSGILQGQHLCL